MSNGGEEVLHLPMIVEAAESSPTAAAAAAQQIRIFLGREWAAKPHVQYNSIMLVRILSDNPGPSFSRNFDRAFVATIKESLRNCRDASTQQILRETLDTMEANKQFQEGMGSLIQMWRKEKGNLASFNQPGFNQPSRSRGLAPPVNPNYQPPSDYVYPTQPLQQGSQPQRSTSRHHTLPHPQELASRIEEARNTAKILLQLIQSTPSDEFLSNELVREFAERCQSAQRSMQGYINCDSPAPDDDTMLTLIETNEQLSLATSRYQRSLLSARKALGMSPSPNIDTMNNASGPYATPPAPAQNGNLFAPNPVMSPPQAPQPQYRTNGQSAFINGNESYQAPAGPPPSMLASLGSRDGQAPSQYEHTNHGSGEPSFEQPSNPFIDPMEHDRNSAPLAIEPVNYGRSPYSQHSGQRPHSQAFSIDAEPTYGQSHSRRNTADSDNPYGVTPSTEQPVSAASSTRPSTGIISPNSPQRPAIGAWHNTGITPSYMGRQTSALNGLTMHGAQLDDTVPEIDGHSEVGRQESDATSSQYTVSPLESRTAQPSRRY